jgi:hypothetical protein
VTGTDLLQDAEAELAAMRIDRALALFHKAEQSGYDADSCGGGRWACYMLMGDFERAWQESDAIAGRGRPDVHRFWTGEDLTGKSVLIRCLHGLGDTIQFIRYAPLLRQRTARLTIEAQPVLKPLLAASRLADEVITWGDPEPQWQAQIEVIELPRLFRTTLGTIPGRVPYISVPQTRTDLLPERNGQLRVGLVWAASAYNPARSLTPEHVRTLIDVPGVQFFNLQAGPERGVLQDRGIKIATVKGEETDVSATAAAVTALDLIITVDTMMAHLAGALARPVWTLLPFQCDWRWMTVRLDSPWYPTMRLFRQTHAGAWNPVIEDVRSALAALSTSRSCFEPADAVRPQAPR